MRRIRRRDNDLSSSLSLASLLEQCATDFCPIEYKWQQAFINEYHLSNSGTIISSPHFTSWAQLSKSAFSIFLNEKNITNEDIYARKITTDGTYIYLLDYHNDLYVYKNNTWLLITDIKVLNLATHQKETIILSNQHILYSNRSGSFTPLNDKLYQKFYLGNNLYTIDFDNRIWLNLTTEISFPLNITYIEANGPYFVAEDNLVYDIKGNIIIDFEIKKIVSHNGNIFGIDELERIFLRDKEGKISYFDFKQEINGVSVYSYNNNLYLIDDNANLWKSSDSKNFTIITENKVKYVMENEGQLIYIGVKI